MLPQMTEFHSCLGLNISVCVHPILSDCISSLWMDTLVELHCLTVSLHCGWIAWLSCVLAAVNTTTASMGVQGVLHLLIPFSLTSCWVLPIVGSIYSFVRICHSIFHNGCANLHPHQQYMRISLYPVFTKAFFFYFLIIVTLTGVSWYLIIVWYFPDN